MDSGPWDSDQPTAGAQVFTAGACAPAGPTLAPPLSNTTTTTTTVGFCSIPTVLQLLQVWPGS